MLGTSPVSSGPNAASTTAASEQTSVQPPFMPNRCLFCNKDGPDFDTNLSHMQTAHGLFVPQKEHLIVDLKVLTEYLHLIIYGYSECICCGTQRNGPLAVQQHMLGKGHCRFDIAKEGSEFADFWDFSESAESDEDDEEDLGEDDSSVKGAKAHRESSTAVQLDDRSLRLPSGKLISKNTTGLQQHQQQRRAEARKQKATIAAATVVNTNNDTTEEYNGPVPSSLSTTLVPSAPNDSNHRRLKKSSEKKEKSFTTQLAKLSDNDRRSLMHLPASEQRAIIATQQKQAEKARRAQRRYQSRVEGLGNKTLMAHYRPDCPARSNG